ncbi:MAG: protein translocase subunit SecD, partial [Candidatus Limnocylindrales bacterium]
MRRAGPILILLIGVAALLINFFPNLRLPGLTGADGSARLIETKLGLDLEGGLRVEYQAQPKDGVQPTSEAMGVIKDIIERRVNSTGVSEPVVVVQGSDRVVVELPGISDVDSVRRLVGQTGQLEFVPLGQLETSPPKGQVLDLNQYPPLFGGDQIQSATVGQDQSGGLSVDFVLKDDGPDSGAQLFAKHTAENIGRYFAVTLDGTVITAPSINSAIPNGQVQITTGTIGGFPAAEANEIVTVLKFGSLPFPIVELSSEQISATLGEQFLNQSLLAGGIGIALVILFMLLYYRMPGIVAGFALIYYTLVVYAIFRLVPVTLTLAGIAGFVLSIGMAVDANILIFERMKEELRIGKSLPAAVEAGFN